MTKADVEEIMKRYPFVTEAAGERAAFMLPFFFVFRPRAKGTEQLKNFWGCGIIVVQAACKARGGAANLGSLRR